MLTQTLSYAQKDEYTIYGYVKDSLTGEPLIGVTVMTNNNKGCFTNSYGFYSFSSAKKNINLSLE